MSDKINEALQYADSNSKLEGLNLSNEEKEIVFSKIEGQENDSKFVELVKKIVTSENEEKEEENGKVR